MMEILVRNVIIYVKLAHKVVLHIVRLVLQLIKNNSIYKMEIVFSVVLLDILPIVLFKIKNHIEIVSNF